MISNAWRDTTIAEVGDIVTGKTPPTARMDYFGGDIPFVTPSDMDGQRFINKTERYLTTAGVRVVKNCRIPSGAIMVSCIGSDMGKVAIAAMDCVTNQQINSIIVDEHKSVPKYVYYCLKVRKDELQRLAGGGSAQPILNKGHFSKLSLRLPPLSIQNAIAESLSILDDKIELNRKMNETLEAMARAIFKSWFVDFDPVRAKAEGRQPIGMDSATAALFPNSFEDSELGEIPKGWKTGTLDEIIESVLGGDWGSDGRTDEMTESARCIRGADIPSLQSGGTGNMPLRFLKPSSIAKRALNNGDVVIEISGGSPTQSTGRPVLISSTLLSRLDAPLVCSNFCRFFTPKTPALSHFIYLWLRMLYQRDEFLQFENGTTGIKNFAFNVFSSSFTLCIPPSEVLEAFNSQVALLFRKEQMNGAEANSLAVIRDTLLPKLLSGALRPS